MRSVLLVHPLADRWLEDVSEVRVDVTTASSAVEARAYLAGTAFDEVWVGPDLEGADRIEALRDALGLEASIVPVAADDLEARLRGTPAPVLEGGAALDEIRGELSRVAHALNNPLAVIAGNAQLAAEMAKAVPTDETVVECIESIQKAAGELEGLFAEVASLRRLVDQARGEKAE